MKGEICTADDAEVKEKLGSAKLRLGLSTTLTSEDKNGDFNQFKSEK